MLVAIGETLPLAFVVAFSPFPIIAIILLLLSPNARSASLAFLGGWMAALLAVVLGLTAIAELLPGSDDTGSTTIMGLITILMGLGLLYLAWQKFEKRPGKDDPGKLPDWMTSFSSATPKTALAYGALLGVNPKNLLVSVSAAILIVDSGLGVAGEIVAVIIFVVLCSVSILGVVLAERIAPAAVAARIPGVQTWLTRNNAVIMAGILLLIGFNVIGKGLARL